MRLLQLISAPLTYVFSSSSSLLFSYFSPRLQLITLTSLLLLCTGDGGSAMDLDQDGEGDWEEKKKISVPQSLRVSAKDISDYYTKAEYTAFLKPKSGKEKKMRKKRREEEVDPLEGLEDLNTSNEGPVPSHPFYFLCFPFFHSNPLFYTFPSIFTFLPLFSSVLTLLFLHYVS